MTVATLDAADFLARLRASDRYRSQLVSVRAEPARGGRFAEVPGGLPPEVTAALAADGIERLYRHQAEAIGLVRRGRSVVVVTGTASGKSLCYQVPLLAAVREDPLATALCLFPTKALTQDQLRGLLSRRGGIDLAAGAYDGDTPTALRRKLRDEAHVILTNPDMLHSGILPNHARWSRFLSRLRYVVVDEIHAYRGVFGSHVANVLRRLRRICLHHGAEPVCVACSATIANPADHAARILGVPVVRVDADGSPRGPRTVALWNPPPVPGAAGDRASPLGEAVRLFAALVREGVQTIVFARTRLAAELIARNAREVLRPVSRRLAASVAAYRGGYLPEERRELERRLAGRDLLGVASTNALELGIDIGTLDACIILGYPGTVASFRQQAGRAGRGSAESLVFLVGRNNPVDQFLMGHGDWLLSGSPERAVVDPENPHVAVGHLRCAAQELPLTPGDADGFGPLAPDILALLEEDGEVRRIGDDWYHASSSYPAAEVSLRGLPGPVFTIEDEGARGRVIGTVDELGALTQLHDHAVYLHAGETWFVNSLDLEQRIARVERRDLDYYTQAVQVSALRIDAEEERREPVQGRLAFGDVTVNTETPMFKKVRFHSRESVGFERLELPTQVLGTVATWWVPPPRALAALAERGLLAGEALIGIANVLVEVLPVFLMCDPSDVGVVVDAAPLGRDALFLFDRFPGGMGYARAALDRFPELLAAAMEVVRACPCERGCPSCVGAAVPPFAATDLDSGVRGRIPDKTAARLLLEVSLPGAEVWPGPPGS